MFSDGLSGEVEELKGSLEGGVIENN